MNELILDLGSGNTCCNECTTILKMIDAIPYDPRIILKWQLFQSAGKNIPLERECFKFAYEYAINKGFKTTASVFDNASLWYLLQFDVPFVKIACNQEYYPLIGDVPRKIPVYASFMTIFDYNELEYCKTELKMACIPNYPSSIGEYEALFMEHELKEAISDHTEGTELFEKYKPRIFECHFKLESSTGLDAGPFAKTPDQIKKILEVSNG